MPHRSVRRLVASLAFSLLAGTVMIMTAGRAHAQASDYVPGEVIVGWRYAPLSIQAVTAAGDTIGTIAERNPALGFWRVRLRQGLSVAQAIAKLRQRPDVAYAEPNYIRHACATPNDASYGLQYAPHLIQADHVWDVWQPTSKTVIAIVDTGVDDTHPDLTGVMDRDTGGHVIGFNEITQVAGPTGDDHGHGTHCAGIAAASINNATGIAGIAGWNPNRADSGYGWVSIMPVKVLDSTGSGSDTNVANGVRWATDHSASVISMSLGDSAYSSTLDSACQYAWSHGVVIVAAAGNSGSSSVFYPAGNANVVSVAATDSTDTTTSWSNYGSWVSVTAPGNNIYSTWPGATYQYLSGTSMATPHVAGVAANIRAQYPNFPNYEVAGLIMNNTDPYTPYNGQRIAPGGGRVNAYKSLTASATLPSTPTSLAGSVSNNVVSLTWNTAPGAAYYNVKRSTVSGGPYTIVGSPVLQRTYSDSSVTAGNVYYYVVTAVNASGESANSNEVAVGIFASPLAAHYVSQSVPATMTAGQTYSVSVTMQNVGSSTWTAANHFGLGSQNPQDNQTWNSGRVAVPSTVTPGQTVTFTFNVTAPASNGTYNFQWRMVQDGVAWFGDTTPNVAVQVSGGGGGGGGGTNNASFVSQSVPASMTAGQTYSVTVTMQNNGTSTWTAANHYGLGSQNPQDNHTWNSGRVAVPSSIAPGQQGVFTFNVTAPANSGSYNFQWRMVQDGVEWFGATTPNVVVQVSGGGGGGGGTNGAQYISQSVPSTMTAGQTYSVSVTMKNTGTSTWTNSGLYRLGSQNPQDNSTWGTGRVVLPQASVAPGAQVTFTFNVTAPSQRGSYNFQWKMVQDLVEWFGDYTPNVNVTVQ